LIHHELCLVQRFRSRDSNTEAVRGEAPQSCCDVVILAMVFHTRDDTGGMPWPRGLHILKRAIRFPGVENRQISRRFLQNSAKYGSVCMKCPNLIHKCPTFFRAHCPRSVCFHTHSGFERIFLTSFFLFSPLTRLFPSSATMGPPVCRIICPAFPAPVWAFVISLPRDLAGLAHSSPPLDYTRAQVYCQDNSCPFDTGGKRFYRRSGRPRHTRSAEKTFDMLGFGIDCRHLHGGDTLIWQEQSK
jgi:hypothetical protein